MSKGVHKVDVNVVEGQNMFTKNKLKIVNKSLELITMIRQTALN